MSAEIRDLFNAARDNDESADLLTAEMDSASYAAGYSIEEYAEAVQAMAAALHERAAQLREEAGL